jgi:NitT/TauT family transport system substrate-binding protein
LRSRSAPLLVVVALVAGACGGGSAEKGATTGGESSVPGSAAAAPASLRLGYYPNLTHATAIVGVEKGFIQKHLGNVKLQTSIFNAGPDAVTALFGSQIDATYVGPNPAINAYQKSNGQAIRIIAGSTSGGASLVVKPEIKGAAGLKGKTLATPQLGNTQDVALRAWLKSKGLKTDTQGGGDVEIKPQDNAQSLETFKSGQIEGAWVPEPWATRLIQEGGGKVLVDERDLWPDGKFVTTHLVVRTEFLKQYPDTVKRLLEGHLEANKFIQDHSAEAKKVVNQGIEAITTKKTPDVVLDAAWKNLTFTIDPIASSLKKSAENAVALGLLQPVDLKGIYDLGPLNELLKAAGENQVKGL